MNVMHLKVIVFLPGPYHFIVFCMYGIIFTPSPLDWSSRYLRIFLDCGSGRMMFSLSFFTNHPNWSQQPSLSKQHIASYTPKVSHIPWKNDDWKIPFLFGSFGHLFSGANLPDLQPLPASPKPSPGSPDCRPPISAAPSISTPRLPPSFNTLPTWQKVVGLQGLEDPLAFAGWQ